MSRTSYGTTTSGGGYTGAYRTRRGRNGKAGRSELIAINIQGEWLSVKDLKQTRKEALTKVGIIGQMAVRASAPNRSGTGAAAIDYVVRLNRVKIRVNPNAEGWYLRMVEIGHRVVVVPYWVRRTRTDKRTGKTSLRYSSTPKGKWKKQRIVIGYARPQPFFMQGINPSLGEMSDAVLDTFGNSVQIERLDL